MNTWRWFQPISFQIIWLACVLGGNEWLFIPGLILVAHFILTPSFKNDLQILPLIFLGCALDVFFTQIGLFVFEVFPFWLMMLWVAFVLNFGHSLGFLRRLKLTWLMIIGAIGGSYAYWISWQLGAVTWPYGPILSTSVIAITWSILLPILVRGDLYFRRLGYA